MAIFRQAQGGTPFRSNASPMNGQLVVAAFFQGEHSAIHNWSATRHPVSQAQLNELPVAAVDGAWTSCGGWFLIEAVEVMAKTAKGARGE